MPFVTVEELEPGIRMITLDRPERRNALSTPLVQELKDALRAQGEDRACRVVVLHGAGAGFCAGADLVADERLPDSEGMSELGYVYKAQQHIAELMLICHELPKPVIAAVHGAAVGGGFALALASDIRVAARSARFGSVFIRVGLSSCDMGTSYFLPRLVGAGKAFELMVTGRHFDADEALGIGLVQRVVDEGQEVDAALEIARLIVANNEYGVWMTKSGMWANVDAPSLRHALELENRTQVLGYFTGNMTEAMHAFREKREPRWKSL